MAEMLAEDYIAKLELLERTVGRQASYRILEPFALRINRSEGYVEIQKAAKRIAEFIGLAGMTFVIEPTQLKEGTCGSIELEPGETETFIQIGTELLSFPNAVLATLCHELSHKFLHRHRIHWGGDDLVSDYHNEVLTDITSVFLGLGKLMLNGHQAERIVKAPSDKVRHSVRVGYLDGNQLGFVYLLTCHMRKLKPRHYLRGLNSKCRSMVQGQENLFSTFFQEGFHGVDVPGSIRRYISSMLEDARSHEGRILETVGGLRRSIESLEVEILKRIKTKDEFEPNPCLRYLTAVELDQLRRRVQTDIRQAATAIDAVAGGTTELMERLNQRRESSKPTLRKRLSRIFTP